jgi:hypothetical protein
VKISRFIPFLVVPLLFSCFPKRPEIPLFEVPHERLVQALELRIRSFSSLKAIAGMQVARKGRKRAFDSVGVLVNGQDQFNIEAYGPLGQTLARLVWDGKELMVDLGGGEPRMLPGSGAGLEKILGARIDPAELCAILSGNIPWAAVASGARFLCSDDRALCVLELRKDDTIVRMRQEADWEAKQMPVGPYEVHRDGKPAYTVRFDSFAQVSGYLLPMKITVENSDKKMSMTMEYMDAEVNVPLDARVFTLPEGVDQ